MAIRKSTAKAEDRKTYDVIERCGVISEGNNGWRTELRFVSWYGTEGKYDIRSWKEKEDGTEQCGKGVTLTGEQLESLGELIKAMAEPQPKKKGGK